MICTNCHQLCPDEGGFCVRCGNPMAGTASLAGADDLLTGRLVHGGRYKVDGLLGRGGMGTVYRAHDVRLARAVALKVMAAELVAHPTARRRMTQEAQALARIEHPNVIRALDVFDEGPLLVMVLELVTGGDLETLVRPGGLDEADAVRLMQGILAGLEAIHRAGLVHRDVKPGNVLLAGDGTPKVTDLGVARDSQSLEKTRMGQALGTPEYMSPEQIQGLGVTAASDVYSAGIVLFELLTGMKPFLGKSEFDLATAHVHHAPDLSELSRKASPQVRAVIAKALAKKPEERFASANAMAAALAAEVRIAAPVSHPPKAPRVAPAVSLTPPVARAVTGRIAALQPARQLQEPAVASEEPPVARQSSKAVPLWIGGGVAVLLGVVVVGVVAGASQDEAAPAEPAAETAPTGPPAAAPAGPPPAADTPYPSTGVTGYYEALNSGHLDAAYSHWDIVKRAGSRESWESKYGSKVACARVNEATVASRNGDVASIDADVCIFGKGEPGAKRWLLGVDVRLESGAWKMTSWRIRSFSNECNSDCTPQ